VKSSARNGSSPGKSNQDSPGVSVAAAADGGYQLRYKSALTCLATLIANADKLLLVRHPCS